MVIVGGNSGGIADAALQRSPLIAATGAGIGVDVVGRQVESSKQVGRDIDLHTLDIALVAIFIERVAFELLNLVFGHFGEFGLQHSQ